MAQLPAHFRPTSGDSAGQPWAGRTFDANPFADDDGSTPPAVAAAMDAFGAGSADEAAVVDALRTARVLIPLVAELGEAGENAEGVTVDKSADLSIVTVAGPDGRTVLPVFTSTAAMRAWNADARPVPVVFRTAAIAAADERTELIIVDPGSATEFGLRRPAVWAVAQDAPWTPSHRDEHVARSLAAAIEREPLVRGLEIAPGAQPGSLLGVELEVTIVTDDDQDAVPALVQRVNVRWSQDADLATSVDSLAVRVRRVAPSASPDNTAPPPTTGRPRGWRGLFRRH